MNESRSARFAVTKSGAHSAMRAHRLASRVAASLQQQEIAAVAAAALKRVLRGATSATVTSQSYLGRNGRSNPLASLRRSDIKQPFGVDVCCWKSELPSFFRGQRCTIRLLSRVGRDDRISARSRVGHRAAHHSSLHAAKRGNEPRSALALLLRRALSLHWRASRLQPIRSFMTCPPLPSCCDAGSGTNPVHPPRRDLRLALMASV
jgi:hypothetical protein